MKRWGVFILGLIMALLVLVVFSLSENWLVSITFLVLLLLVVLVRLERKKETNKLERKRQVMIAVLSERLKDIESKVSETKDNLEKNMFAIETTLEDEISNKDFRRLARRSIDLENKINGIKKTMSSGLGSLDGRVKRLEEEARKDF